MINKSISLDRESAVKFYHVLQGATEGKIVYSKNSNIASVLKEVMKKIDKVYKIN